MLVVAILCGSLICVVQASFFEWAFHRYWLHRPWLPESCFTSHTLIHHQLCKHDDTFVVVEEEQEEALTFKWWGGPALILINLAPWALGAWGLAAAGVSFPSLAFLIAFAVTMSLYYAGYEGLHHLMHKPALPFIVRSRYFRFIERHHRIHHIHMDRNLNVLLPLADLCLGTLVTAMPAATPTPEAARKLARRHSEFGRRMQGGPR
ncbi:MAG: hypothetical protein E6K81_06175 [Candidatus Eisenbacteria bacterium]|uniref:Uncharacterized protein n=1 Tax=Eiseniibacteriota bacterium TaxID=2212470 RepID=A0A538UAN2_UNCEI|nr:MAG: hypothetical protein E6K81_06175 [Candidatus Eisenbacteria bacterium]